MEKVEVTLRNATPEDTERIAAIMFDDPGIEVMRLAFNDERLASALSKELVRMPGSTMGWRRTVLAERDGMALGVLQADSEPAVMPITLRLMLHFAGMFGPVKVVRAQPRFRARRRVGLRAPAGAYVVHELHVHPEHRNCGIGGVMLDYAEAEAKRRGNQRMSLETHMANPARHLYERHGFRIVATATDAAYERYTAIPGRYLLVKELT